MDPNISKIELPTSMKKVGPSEVKNPSNQCVLVINQTFPSQMNVSLAKHWQKGVMPGISFEMKPPSDDLKPVLKKLGVPEEVFVACQNASKTSGKESSAKVKNVHHTSLVGIADPAGKIPVSTRFLCLVVKGTESQSFSCMPSERSCFLNRLLESKGNPTACVVHMVPCLECGRHACSSRRPASPNDTRRVGLS